MPNPAPAKRLPRALTLDELTTLLNAPRHARDRALIHVMANCGLRVSEACSLRLEDVVWTDTPVLRFVGKGNQERLVPMNLEVQDALRAWLEVRGADGSPYVFCTLRKRTRLSRKTVWFTLRSYARKAGLRHVHPHMLRHTFGTSLADEGVPIERIRDLMGHRDISSSAIYIQVSAAQKRTAVEKIDRRPWLLRWISRQRNRTFQFLTGLRPRSAASKLQTVGRRAELHRLQQNLSRRIDTLVIGPVGSGKSHLLGRLEGEKVIRMPSLSPVRQSVIALAEELHCRRILKADLPADAEQVSDDLGEEAEEQAESDGGGGVGVSSAPPASATEPTPSTQDSGLSTGSFDELRKRHTRTTVRGWVQMISDAVQADEWALIVDDLSDLSASVGRLIDHLNKRFVIFAAAVEIKKPYEKHFWKFERGEGANLPKRDAADLIRQAGADADIEDYRLFETHVLQKSAGNPRAVLEIVDRLRKEPSITRSAVRDVAHVGARGKLDMTPVLFLLAAIFIAARYVSRRLDNFDGYMLAGIGSAGFMVLRFFMSRMMR